MHIATLMLLGSGELGKEFAIAAKRLGCRVIACDRYANAGGVLVRVDPVVLLRKTLAQAGGELVPFALRDAAAVRKDLQTLKALLERAA